MLNSNQVIQDCAAFIYKGYVNQIYCLEDVFNYLKQINVPESMMYSIYKSAHFLIKSTVNQDILVIDAESE